MLLDLHLLPALKRKKRGPYFVLRRRKDHENVFFVTLLLLEFPGLFHFIQLQVGKGIRLFVPAFISSFHLKFYILVFFSYPSKNRQTVLENK